MSHLDDLSLPDVLPRLESHYLCLASRLTAGDDVVLPAGPGGAAPGGGHHHHPALPQLPGTGHHQLTSHPATSNHDLASSRPRTGRHHDLLAWRPHTPRHHLPREERPLDGEGLTRLLGHDETGLTSLPHDLSSSSDLGSHLADTALGPGHRHLPRGRPHLIIIIIIYIFIYIIMIII